MADQHLVLIALRSDDPRMVDQLGRMLADTGAIRPDSSPCVFAKPVGELVTSDLESLTGFFEWDDIDALNVGRGAVAAE